MGPNYLSNALPYASPADFELSWAPGKKWLLWQIDHPAIAVELERWVVRQVLRNVEMARPGVGDDDLAHAAYFDAKSAAQERVERGEYAAMTPNWKQILVGSPAGAGFAEVLYQCVRFKNDEWTREHVTRIMKDKDERKSLWDFVLDVNFPKAPAGPAGEPNGTPPPA